MNVCSEIVCTRKFSEEEKLRASPHLTEMKTLCATLCGVLFGVDGLRKVLTNKDMNELSLTNCFFRYAVAMIRSWTERSNSLVVHVGHEESFLCLWAPRWIPLRTIEILPEERSPSLCYTSPQNEKNRFEALLVTLRQRTSRVATLIVPMFFDTHL